MDKDTPKVSESPESAKSREGTSRRRLLLAGAAAVPVMVTIKSTGASAAGMKAIQVHGTKSGGWDYNPPNDMLASISCIQNVEMPWDCDGAAKKVCDKEQLDYDGWCRRKRTGYSSVEQDGSVMPASYQPVYGTTYNRYQENDDKCDQIYTYFYDDGRTNFWPGCKFDVSKERHCTYVQICLSTACWNSISTAVNLKGGTTGIT